MQRFTRRAWARRTIALALTVSVVGGCATDREPVVNYLGKASLKFYKDHATEIDYPVGVEGDVTGVVNSQTPRTVTSRDKDELWELSLTEALHCALTNNKVIRTRAVNRNNPSSLGINANTLTNPDNANSIYDPAIQESGVLFGGRGVEAALADFDAQFTTSMLWARNEAYQNSALAFGQLPGPGMTNAPELVQETASFNSAVSKQFATGGSVSVFHNWNYLGTNQRNVIFPSTYTGQTGLSFRQPLLAGGGVEYTRIAGPTNPNFRAITGVNQGVLIARINNDITLANFEISTRNLLKQVEDTYWDLYFAYRAYDTTLTARNSALRGWREAKAKLDIGGVQNFKPADEAQARDRYFETRAQVETALNAIYTTEAELRRLMGLPPNDCRVIRPCEEPTTAKIMPDWHSSLCEALMHRAELRRQKWNIKSLELQLVAARNLTMPRLDFVSQYQVNGFGDDLLGTQNDGVTSQNLGSGYGTLLNGDQTGYNVGFEFSVPIGFRQARTQVRNIELRLAKAREVLATQELDVAHEVADSLQQIEFNYQNAETNFNRRNAAARRVALFEAELEAGTVTLDEVLRAQASLATAEVEFFRSLVQYNQSIALLHFTKGTLLARDNVQLEEGAWTPQAYQQALRRAWDRSHAFRNPMLRDDPSPFAIPEDSRQLVSPSGTPMPDGSHQSPGQAVVPPAPSAELPPGTVTPVPTPAPDLQPTPAPAEEPAGNGAAWMKPVLAPESGGSPVRGGTSLASGTYSGRNPFVDPDVVTPNIDVLAAGGPATPAENAEFRVRQTGGIGPSPPSGRPANNSSLFPEQEQDFKLPIHAGKSTAMPGRASIASLPEEPTTKLSTLGTPRGPSTDTDSETGRPTSSSLSGYGSR